MARILGGVPLWNDLVESRPSSLRVARILGGVPLCTRLARTESRKGRVAERERGLGPTHVTRHARDMVMRLDPVVWAVRW